MIRITFLGTRGLVEEQNEAHKHHTAYIIEDGKQRVLFDFGETWAQEPLPNVDAIWISHAHPDHIGGLDGRVVDIPIFCSAVTKSLLPKGLKANDVHIIEHKKEFDLLKWRALPFPVTHSIIAPATGLRLVVDGQVIVLPSDVLYFESADDLMKDAILYIADGSTLEKSLVRKHKETGELFGHAALRQQLRWCQKYGVPLLFAIHYGKEPIGMTDPVLARWLQQTQEAVAPDASAHIAWDGKVVEIEGNRVRWRRKRGEWVEETLTQSRVSVPLVRPPFKYPAGKARLAPRLVDLLPEHKRYVEPFCGAAAVFFAKEPSEEEILADIDPDVIFALKWMRNATEKDIREFSRLELVGTRADFERIKNRKPRTPTERAHKVIYLLRFSWAANRISFSAPDGGRDLKAFVRDLPRWRQRLKDAHLLVQDWRKTLDEFDSTGTLFYLDPLYEDTKNVGDAPTAEELADRLRRLKGKFLLTWRGDIKPFKESGFQIRKVVHHSNPNFADVVWTEYIIANYDLPRKRFEVRYSQDTPKKIEIPEIRVSLLPRGIPAKARGVADAFGIAEHPEHTLVKPATVRIESGDRVLIVGHSGSGKSLLLARLVKELKAATPQFEENKPCVDHFKDLDFNEALAIFARCGLSDVYFMLRTPAELSDGQCARFALATLLASNADFVAVDRFLEDLDEDCKRVVGYLFAREIKERGKVLLAATHTEPPGFPWSVRVMMREFQKPDIETREEVQIEKPRLDVELRSAKLAEVKPLLSWHYRGGQPVATRFVSAAYIRGNLAGTAILTHPLYPIRAMLRLFPDVNHQREVVVCSRVVVHPNYRSVGISKQLLKHAVKQAFQNGVKVVYSLSRMALLVPLFKAAGWESLRLSLDSKKRAEARKVLSELGYKPRFTLNEFERWLKLLTPSQRKRLERVANEVYPMGNATLFLRCRIPFATIVDFSFISRVRPDKTELKELRKEQPDFSFEEPRRRKLSVNVIIEGSRAEEILIKDISRYDPSKLNDAVLQDDWRIIIAWWARLRRGGKFKYSREQVLNLATKIFNELVKRDKVTFHWEGLTDAGKDLLRACLERTAKEGIYLVPPHGELIAKGEKTAMVKSRAFKLRGFYLLCSGSLCYGWVRFKSRYDSNEYPKRISVKEFKELQHAHCISDEERKAWWGGKGWLYYYPIREFIPLPRPRKFRLPQGAQTFIREVEFLQKFDIKQITPAALREMTTNELVLLHAELHRAFWATYRKGAVEPIVNAHAWVVDEMRRRGMDTRPIDLLDTMSRRFELLAQKIYLREVLPYFPQRIVLNDREIALIGSLAIAGRGNDIDLLFAGQPDRVREFRVAMLFPPNLRQRLHFVYDDQGPFTNYIPLYRKVLERIDPIRIVPMQKEPEAEFKVTLMRPFPLMKASSGYHIGEFFDRDSLWRLWAEPHIREVGYIYIEPKYDGIRMCIHKKGKKVAIYTEDAKRDRAHIFPEAVEEIRKLPEDELILDAEFVWWKEGAPIPRQKMMHFVVGKEPLRGEEIHINVFDVLWADGKSLQFLPFAKRKRILQRILPRDKKFLKPVPSKTARNRKEFDKALDWATTFIGSEGAMLKDPRGFYDAKRTTSWAKLKNIKEAKFIIIGRRKVPAGRPARVKWTEEEAFKNLPSLLKKSRTWIYRVAFLSRNGKTLIPMEERKKLTDKDLTLRWNEEKQRWEGFDDPKLWEMGLGFKDRKAGEYAYANTYASALEPPPKIGDIITVTPIAIDKWVGDDGKEHYSWMFPIVREADPTRDKPDDQDFIDHLVEVSRGQFKRKKAEQEAIEKLEVLTVTEEFEAFLKWAAAWNAPREDEELARIIKMPELDEKRRKLIEKWASLTIDELHEIDPRKLPRFFYVIQHHFRGKSVHKDFRVKVDDHLEGFTITDQVKGYIKETVDNIQEAKRYTLDPKAERLHPEMDPADHCFAVEKAQQPLVWLTIVKDVFLPGTVGATRFNEGVFYGRDWGLLWLGTRKPYFIELFLRGKNFRGTLVFRKLPARPEWEKVPKEGLHWECWFTRKDTPPYLLTERARRRKDYVPPDGISGLPPEFEALIEKELPDLVWWKGKLTAAEKLAKIDRVYNWLIENQYLKGPKVEVSQETQAKTARFTFLRIWWKGQTVIRAMPQERFFLLLKDGGFRVWELDANPLWEAAQSVLQTEMPEPPPEHKEITDWMKFEGDLPPKHALNPTKRLTAHAEIIDTGAARLIEDTEHFLHIDFRGKNFKGRWVLKREEPDSPVFTFEPAVGPGQALEEDKSDGYGLDEIETAAESSAAADS